MPMMKRFLLLPLLSLVWILLAAACGGAPTGLPTPLPTMTIAPPTQLAIDTPTVESQPTLKAGQSTFVFYHTALGRVLLVNGGPESGKPAQDPLEIWSWDGTRWTLVTADPEGPTWRNWAAIAYDPARNVLVVHGGIQNQMNGFDETWEWDGYSWKTFISTGPGGREGALMVYDATRQAMVLFGGAEGMEIKGDTWEWKDGEWSKVSEIGPAPRFPAGMVYDPLRQQVLLYSGHFAASSGDFVPFDDLWAWDGVNWKQLPVQGETPGHRTHAALVFDPDTENILLFSGGADTFLSDIWAWDGESWMGLPVSGMPARSGHSVAYDPGRDRFVLFGGIDQPARPALGDTWEWDRVTWLCADNC
jgi:hypothetical protein